MSLSKRKKALIKYLLVEEMLDEEVLQSCVEPRATKHPLFQARNEEGFFQSLITNHLREDDKKFSEFFRVSISQFDFILNLIKDDIQKLSCNGSQYPVTPDEKLAITLR